MAFDGCCPDCKLPGDDCPLVWGQCSHCFHIHCIVKWLNSQSVNQLCPMCRQDWKFKEWKTNKVHFMKDDITPQCDSNYSDDSKSWSVTWYNINIHEFDTNTSFSIFLNFKKYDIHYCYMVNYRYIRIRKTLPVSWFESLSEFKNTVSLLNKLCIWIFNVVLMKKQTRKTQTKREFELGIWT